MLMAATTTVAKLMGVFDETGAIQVGKSADLVLLAADPLADIANVRRQDGVMLRGRWYSADDISRRLSALRESK